MKTLGILLYFFSYDFTISAFNGNYVNADIA